MTKKIQSFEVPALENPIRLDLFLADIESIRNRSQAAKLIQAGGVKVEGNSKALKASHLLKGGETISVELIALKTEPIAPKDIPLNILFEDEDIIVVNKASGLVVHPAFGHQEDTLVNALLHHTKDLSMGFGEERPGIVHRLDKETSGTLVIAKNNLSHEKLSEQFQNRTLERYYWAICFHLPKTPQGTIESYIDRHPVDRLKMASFDAKSKKGKRAVTNYETLGSYKKELSLVKYKLETGRTHQIRVHSKDQLFPLVGDWLYCKKSKTNSIQSGKLRKIINNLDRFCLHAAILGFTHPRTGEFMRFLAPIPEELLELSGALEFTDIINKEFHL